MKIKMQPRRRSTATNDMGDQAAQRIGELERRLALLTRENQRLSQLAHCDELTGLGNRRGFNARLDQALAYIDRYGGAVSIVLVDLDGMKRLNDAFGHPEGDRILARIGEILARCVRSADFAARLGGDEFAVIMPSASSLEAGRLGERIRLHVAELEPVGLIPLTASLGAATFEKIDSRSVTADELYSTADTALYRAKSDGRNQVRTVALAPSECVAPTAQHRGLCAMGTRPGDVLHSVEK